MKEYETINLKELILLILKKWWLLLIFTVVTATMTHWISSTYTVPLYKAQATLFIGKDSSVLANINVNDLKFSNELVNDYRELIKSRLVTDEVVSTLEYTLYYEQLIKNLNIFTVEGTRFMYISYQDTTPERAANIVNKFSEVIKEKAEEIVGVQNIRIVDYAVIPNNPFNTDNRLIVFIGGIIGLILAILVIFIIMMMDNTVKSESFIEETVGVPVLGKIQYLGEKGDKNTRNQRLVTLFDPMSYVSESYKMFRTNLGYTNVDKQNQVILCTSSLPSEGKTTSVANLGISFAKEGKKVLIIECDLRRASVHEIFNLSQTPGLTSILAGTSTFEKTVQKMVGLKNLDVLTSDVLPPSPSDLLGAKSFQTLIDHVCNLYDVVLLDAPPILLVSDAIILSRYADGVILIVALKESKKENVMNSVKALNQVSANILGVLLTKDKVANNEYKYSYNSNDKTKKR